MIQFVFVLMFFFLKRTNCDVLEIVKCMMFSIVNNVLVVLIFSHVCYRRTVMYYFEIQNRMILL